MKDRKFGVEIEFGVDDSHLGGSRGGRVLGATTRHYGQVRRWLDIACAQGKIGTWDLGHDGTELEAKSPPLSGLAGFAELKFVMAEFKKLGGYVTRSDGMHVHHDAPEFLDNVDLVKRLVRSWLDNRQMIGEFCDPIRTSDSWHSPKWDEARFEVAFSDKPYLDAWGQLRNSSSVDDVMRKVGSRNDLNIRALSRHGTIEFRLHEGTLEFEQAEAWIRFGQAFLNKVVSLKKPISPMESHDQLLKRLRTSQKVSGRLLQRVPAQAVPAQAVTFV